MGHVVTFDDAAQAQALAASFAALCQPKGKAQAQAAPVPLAFRQWAAQFKARVATEGAWRAADEARRAHAEWLGLTLPERVMLLALAEIGGREVGLPELAGREWGEFTPPEQQALGQAVRVLQRRLGRLRALVRGG